MVHTKNKLLLVLFSFNVPITKTPKAYILNLQECMQAFGIASVEGGNGVVIMLNSGNDVNGLGKEIRRAGAKIYNWTNFLAEEIQPISLSDSELDKFTGRYKMSDDEVLVLKRENNYLVEKINEGSDIYCFPIAKDTIIFSGYNVKGFFIRDNKGEVIGLQNIYQEKPMPKMKDNEFSPSEYLRIKKYDEAQNAFRQMKMNEYKVTYLAYDLMNKKPMDINAVKIILELAVEQNPTSSIVYSRWGDYYLKLNDKVHANKSYEKAVELDPNDQQTRETLLNLKK